MKKLCILFAIITAAFLSYSFVNAKEFPAENFIFGSYKHPLLKHRMNELISDGNAYATSDEERQIPIGDGHGDIRYNALFKCVLRSTKNHACLVEERRFYDKDGNFDHKNIEANFPPKYYKKGTGEMWKNAFK